MGIEAWIGTSAGIVALLGALWRFGGQRVANRLARSLAEAVGVHLAPKFKLITDEQTDLKATVKKMDVANQQAHKDLAKAISEQGEVLADTREKVAKLDGQMEGYMNSPSQKEGEER